MSDTSEQTAQRIADRGRDALLERLRPAFKEAAQAHAEVLQLSDETLEQMVQRAADRADGLQWRRALATVAAEELGIGLGEALDHPAVVRAHEIVGAPSYEESLATLRVGRSGAATSTMDEPAVQAPDLSATDTAVREPEAPVRQPESPIAEPESTVEEPALQEPEPLSALDEEPIELHETQEQPLTEAHAAPAAAFPEPAEFPAPAAAFPEAAESLEPLPEADEEPGALRVSAVHVSGVADLEPGERDIELQLSEAGLDIVRGADEILGRLRWEEIRTLDVPSPRGARRRRREPKANLVIRTGHGEASFEVPAVSPEELREHLRPLLDRYLHG